MQTDSRDTNMNDQRNSIEEWYEKHSAYDHDVDWYLDYGRDVTDSAIVDFCAEMEAHTDEWENGDWNPPVVEYQPFVDHPILGKLPYFKDYSVDITSELKIAVLFGTLWERKYPREEGSVVNEDE